MRFYVKCFSVVYAVLLTGLALHAESNQPRLSFHIMGDDPGGWPELLSSLGLTSGTGGADSVIIAPHGTNLPPTEWAARVEHGAILVLEGESPLASPLFASSFPTSGGWLTTTAFAAVVICGEPGCDRSARNTCCHSAVPSAGRTSCTYRT